LLKQQPHIHGFITGLIREAAKIRFTTSFTRFETPLAYLALFGLLIACWLAWLIARASFKRPLQIAWALALLVIIAAAYYVDSRIEVQQYEYSLHRLMFLIATAAAMALAATLYFSLGLKFSPRLRIAAIIAAVVILAAVSFTFAHFDKDQNLKTQIFYRTTQAKQHFKLAQWALDFDRDGYSAYLGGGDADDSRGDINPGEIERIGDGIDNNCIGGDLTQQALDDWKRRHSAFHGTPDPDAKRLNIIYIFIDTVRADHLSVYGYHRNTSPNIDKLAAKSSVFENAFTPSPSTFEAMPKFMQSSYWDAHLDPWTKVVNSYGYNTILFPGRRDTTLPRRIKDETINVQGKSESIKETIDSAMSLISAAPADRPFCLYLYSFEPHKPYRKHDKFYFGPSQIDLYDGEIAYSDFHYGRLFDWLEQTGRLKDTMIVIMSDHGESHGERGVYKHTSQLYNEQMRVPMIIYIPGLAPRRIPDYVSTIDLGTTILNASGLEVPKDYVGVSLLPLMRGEAFTHPPVFGEHINRFESAFVSPEKNVNPEIRKYMVVTQDGYKLIYNRNFYNFELYNLKDDPREERNLYDRMPEKAEQMKKLLGEFIDVVVVSRPWDADESKYFVDKNGDND
ncbi:MAG TPA: sulfatase-like hydrolase/transferase, partial [Blastocatellia bacterium]|nr:sulfatase-like hydrolase/transferase [Blastocatellia bacterium]